MLLKSLLYSVCLYDCLLVCGYLKCSNCIFMKLVLLTDNVFAQKWVILTGMFVTKCIYFDLLLHCWHTGVSMVKTMVFHTNYLATICCDTQLFVSGLIQHSCCASSVWLSLSENVVRYLKALVCPLCRLL